MQELWELQLSAIAAATGAAVPVPVPVGIAFLLRRSPASFQDCNIPSAVLDLLRVCCNSCRRFQSCSWCNTLHLRNSLDHPLQAVVWCQAAAHADIQHPAMQLRWTA